MKNLIFKRVVLLSDSQKSANQFVFQKKYNLITGNDNSAGKSTLVKTLLWTLGCKPTFKKSWLALDIKALVECQIDGEEYKFYRYQDSIKVSHNGEEYRVFSQITGEYSEFFANLVKFYALLPKKIYDKDSNPELQTPPPSFYFTPFYIDQKTGWIAPWGNFEDLYMFARWQATIVKYHTGYLSPEHFEIEQKIYDSKRLEKIANDEVKRIDTAIDVVDEYVPKANFTIDEKELATITDEVQGTLDSLAQEQEITLDKLSNKTSDKYHISKQLELLEEAIRELEGDYTFSVENIESDNLECPLCGTHHDNTIISKAEILADKSNLESQAKIIRRQVNLITKEIKELSEELDFIKSKVSYINMKYSIKDKSGEEVNLSNIVDSLASRMLQNNVSTAQNEKKLVVHDENENQKEFLKKQRGLLTKKQRDELNQHFRSQLELFISLLKASGVNLEGVKSPTNYSKIFKDGGEAENTRAILAYQTATMQMISKYGAEILAPFVIDTPRQQEQNPTNYENIVDLILKGIPKHQQVFLCALDDPLIASFKVKSREIRLNEIDKILKSDHYEELRSVMVEAIEAR